MPTQKTSRLRLPYWQKGDRDWHVQFADAVALLDALEALGSLAVLTHEDPSTTLGVDVAAGTFLNAAGAVVAYAGDSNFLLTASATNSLYLTDAGVLTKSTTGFPAATNLVPLAVAVTDGTKVTSLTLARRVWRSGGGASAFVPLAGGDDSAGPVVVHVGTTNGTKLGGATTEKIGFFNATPVVQPANTVELVALLVSLGLRATGGNPALNLGTGALTCGTAAIQDNVTLTDAKNVAVGTATGTKFGTATNQKIGFLNATPVVQQANSVDLAALLATFGFRASGGNPPLNLGTGAITCGALNVGGLVTLGAFNVVLDTTTGTKLGTAAAQKLGFWNATPIVQPASANQAALGALTMVTTTDSTTGTASDTLNDVTGSFSQSILNSNFASIARMLNRALADSAASRTLVNQLRSDLVAAGLLKGSA